MKSVVQAFLPPGLSTGILAGWGRYLPARVVTSDELASHLKLPPGWIERRTGIAGRRIAGTRESTLAMACAAAEAALAQAALSAEHLDLILVATSTPDQILPPISSQLQHALGALHAGAMQVSVGCTGFIYALASAQQFIATGTCTNVLVVGAERLSGWVNWDDPETCPLFGDGAGAVVLTAAPLHDGRRQAVVLGSDGAHGSTMTLPLVAYGRSPWAASPVSEPAAPFRMEGGRVFRFALEAFSSVITSLLERSQLEVDDVDLILPHQANARLIQAAIAHAQLPPEKVYVNLERYGNTSAASIPIALSEALDGEHAAARTLMLVAFGAGLTWGGTFLQVAPRIA